MSRPAMEGLRFRDAMKLVELVEASSDGRSTVVRKQYEERGIEFDTVLQFLVSLGILRRERDYIMPGKGYGAARDLMLAGVDEFTSLVLRMAARSDSPFGREVQRLMVSMELRNGVPTLMPLRAEDELYAARNALIDGNVLLLDHEDGTCRLHAENFGLYALGVHGGGLSVEDVRREEEKRGKIGDEAEIAVLEYEKERVGPEMADQVIHVAAHNTAAGFDISSFRQDEGEVSQMRLIEVKAVSPEDFRFFLTRNEYATAREHGDAYYLYLVPIRRGRPEIAELVVLREPTRTVMNDATQWEVVADGFRCRRWVDHEGA